MPRQTKPVDNNTLETLNASRSAFLSYLRARIANKEVAEDILQQSLMKALKARDSLKNKESVVPWFYAVLQHALIDYYRHRATDKRKLEALKREMADAKDLLPHESKKAVCQCMHRLLPAMNPDYASLVERIDLKEESSEKVAKELGVTPNNLNVRLHRARKALKQQLKTACGSCADHGCLDCSCKQPQLPTLSRL